MVDTPPTPPTPPKKPATPSPVGHVAPDVKGGKHVNTLVPQPQYKIELSFVDAQEFDMFFPESVSTSKGRMARLQALDLFPLPLDHAKAGDCLKVCWRFFRDDDMDQSTPDAAPPAKEKKAEEKLVQMLHSMIVESGRFTDRGYANNIYLPGNYSTSPLYKSSKSTSKLKFGDNRYTAESAYLTANDWLHKIPIKVTVTKKNSSGKWVPAEHAKIYFQLVKPPPRQPNSGQERLEPLATPKAFFDSARAKPAPAADDPQSDNVHTSQGGKRGLTIDKIFEVGKIRPGFHIKKPDGPPLSHYDYTAATVSAEADIKNAVWIYTNELGQGGVIFMPSRCAGDRYKIRAFVGRGTLESNGREIESDSEVTHVAEIGTQTIWRRARLLRGMRIPVPAQASVTPALINNIKALNPAFNTPEKLYERIGLKKEGAAKSDILGTVDISTNSYFSRQFSRAYINMEAVHPAEEQMTVDQYRKAFEFALSEAARLQDPTRNGGVPVPAYLKRFDIPKLVYFDENDPFFTSIRAVADYNALVTDASKKIAGWPLNNADANDIYNVLGHFRIYLPGFFTKNGFLPGMVYVRAPRDDFYSIVSGNGFTSSGEGGEETRCCTVFFGVHTYRRDNNFTFDAYQKAGASFPSETIADFSLQANTCHEVGHTMFMLHQSTGGAGGGDDSQHDAGDQCVMSYGQDSEGDYCGKCLMNLGGWNVNGTGTGASGAGHADG